MTQRAGRATPVYFYQRDAAAMQRWLAAGPQAGAVAALKERLDAALANNTDPVRLPLTEDEAAALLAALRTMVPGEERSSETAVTVLRILQEAYRPPDDRQWRHKPAPTHW